MKKLDNRVWMSVALISIIAPISLLTTFRLMGILSEPATIAQTTTLETIRWESERPYGAIDIREEVKDFYEKEIRVEMQISIEYYIEGAGEYGGSDYISLVPNVTATLKSGFIYGVNVTFKEDYENSLIHFFESQTWPKYYSHAENLSIVDYKHFVWMKGSGLKAFVELAGVNHPKSIHFDGLVNWVLGSPQNQTHALEVATELVYYNGTAYKEIVQPFQLRIGPDNNNSFETAQEIREGYYPKLYIGAQPDVGDFQDYYKINAALGQRIRIDVDGTKWSSPIIPNPSPFFFLFLYDPDRNLVFESEGFDNFQTVDFTANATGFWFIEVRLDGSHGFYSLGVNQ